LLKSQIQSTLQLGYLLQLGYKTIGNMDKGVFGNADSKSGRKN